MIEITIANAGLIEDFCEHGSEMISLSVPCREASGSGCYSAWFFWLCKNLFRGTKLVFHLLAVANLSDPLENDLVVHINSLLDDEDVVHFVLDDDLALMHHVIFVDDVNVPLVENLESRPLRDDDGVVQRSVDQHVAGLTVTQQAVRVRKIRAEGDVPGLVVEFGLDRTDLAGLRELAAVRQHEFDFLILLILTPGRPCIRGSGPRVR